MKSEAVPPEGCGKYAGNALAKETPAGEAYEIRA
jgi:hypothetical protein